MSQLQKIRLFILLSAAELFIAAIFIFRLTFAEKGKYGYLISATCFLGSIGIVMLSRWIKKCTSRLQTLTVLIENRRFQGMLTASLAAFVGYIFLSGISWNRWSPLIVMLCLVEFQLIILFPCQIEKFQTDPKKSSLLQTIISAVGVISLYFFLASPSKISTILDGIPWETKFEFVLAGLFIPFLVLINFSYFRRPWVLLLILTTLVIRISLVRNLPETGLDIQEYRASNNEFVWVPGYTSTDPSRPQVMNASFNNLREFPIEWVNSPSGGIDNNRIMLSISGFAKLKNDERLIFLIQGMQTGSIILTDLATQNTFSASIIDGSREIERNLFDTIQLPDRFMINANIVYKKGVQHQFSPIILKKDGAVSSAFESLKLWRTKNGVDLPIWQLDLSKTVLNTLNYLIIAIIVWGILDGLWIAFSKQQINPIDIFLFAISIFCLLATQGVSRINQPLFFSPIICLIGILRFAPQSTPTRSTKPFLFTVGLVFLLLFLRLDIEHLREISLFPEGQDNIEYQTLARNIYVKGDFLLLDNPPRAYKVLFPYLVGILHIFFGQSSAAQLFLNAWCALLSALLFLRILQNQKISSWLAYTPSLSLLLILCLPSFYIFYFRFGLIEPVAIVMLLATMFYSSEKKIGMMFIAGFLTVLLRLDYIGITFASIILSTDPLLGEIKTIVDDIVVWLLRSWKNIVVFAFLLCSGPVSIIGLYFYHVPNYLLNAGDTQHASIGSVLEGITKIILGGNLDELRLRYLASPFEAILISLVLVFGTTIAFLSIVKRKGIFRHIDLRWGIVLICFLMAYIIVRPTGYSPRFSTPLLPLTLMMITLCYQTPKMHDLFSGYKKFWRGRDRQLTQITSKDVKPFRRSQR